ncbi:MAG TPA: phosphopantetheine-binding protein [Steroidobacteraceae bacterium]|nr:phosphopantetheine-binding protein [Steroidobacteraceae bacterium]
MELVTDITHKLITQVATASGADPAALSEETTLQAVGVESVLLALILRAIETEFAIEFDDDEVADFLGASSIGDYVDIVRAALNRGHQA